MPKSKLEVKNGAKSKATDISSLSKISVNVQKSSNARINPRSNVGFKKEMNKNFSGKTDKAQILAALNDTAKTTSASERKDIAFSKIAKNSNSIKETTGKSRPRSSIAASYLSKTADGLAKLPKRNFDKNQTKSEISCNQVKSPVRQPSSPRISSPVSTPSKVTNGGCIPVGFQTSQYKYTNTLGITEKNLATSSPTVAKIPCDIVRQRVDTIQVTIWYK